MASTPPIDCNKSIDRDLDINIMFALASAGIIIKMFLNQDTSDITNNESNNDYNGPATSTIWGYGLSAISLFTLIFISIGLANKCLDLHLNDFLNKFLSDSIPIVCLLFILVWIIILNIVYFKRINQKRVANEYNTYSFISSILIIMQLAILYKKMSKGIDSGIPKIENNIFGIICILTLLNFIFVGMMNVVLKFYSTDG